MIDLNKAKEEFLKYADSYDQNHPKISLKRYHSLRVMDCSTNIAKSIGLKNEELDLATLIGLLHDIARFEQMTRYGTFSDKLSIDHGDFGIEILEENNFIRKFIETDKYDDVIKVAIKNHNKYAIEDGLSRDELLHSKIIRDADKLDIFFEAETMFWEEKDVIEKINNSVLTESYFEQCLAHKPIVKKPIQTETDRVLVLLSFIYDINFEYTLKFILEKDYINTILNKFDFKNKETKKQMELVRKTLNEYINKKTKDEIG